MSTSSQEICRSEQTKTLQKPWSASGVSGWKAIHAMSELAFPSRLSSVSSCFHIITDEWPVLISLRLWETGHLGVIKALHGANCRMNVTLSVHLWPCSILSSLSSELTQGMTVKESREMVGNTQHPGCLKLVISSWESILWHIYVCSVVKVRCRGTSWIFIEKVTLTKTTLNTNIFSDAYFLGGCMTWNMNWPKKKSV